MQLSKIIELFLYIGGIPVSIFFSLEDLQSRSVSRNVMHISLALALILRVIWTMLEWSILSLFEAGAVVLLLLLLWVVLARMNTRKFGIGDVKYMLLMALVLMTQKVIVAILCAALLAILAWLVWKPLRDRKTGIPFIPFLFVGGVLSVFVSPYYYQLMEQILSF